jgi:putative DNA-invertase from lambdoid prophage Rac
MTDVPAPSEPSTFLAETSVDVATLKALRVAYKELRAAYDALYALHHERIVAALAERKAEGKKTGGDVPYGYRLGADGETLIEHKDEQRVIAEVIKLREEGASLRGIARALWKKGFRARQVPGRRARLKSKRTGMFDPTQIRRMIDLQRKPSETR